MAFMVCPLGTGINSYVTLYSEVFPFIIMCISFILEPYLQHHPDSYNCRYFLTTTLTSKGY